MKPSEYLRMIFAVMLLVAISLLGCEGGKRSETKVVLAEPQHRLYVVDGIQTNNTNFYIVRDSKTGVCFFVSATANWSLNSGTGTSAVRMECGE